jgi:hypothetical protein
VSDIVTYELYGGAIVVHYQDDKHRYTVQHVDAEGIYSPERWSPSVTGVSGQLDKSNWLKPWAVKMALEVCKKKIKPGKAYNEYELMNIWDEAKAAHTIFTQKAANIGTLVHDWAERYILAKINGTDIPDMPTAAPVVRGVNAFLKWDEQNEVEYLFSEKIVYSIEHHYIGTFDVGAIINGEHVLVDFKTSSGVYDEHRIQAAGYVQAANEEFEEQFTNVIILHLSKTTGIPKPHDMRAEHESNPKKYMDLEGYTRTFNNLRAVYKDTKEDRWNL